MTVHSERRDPTLPMTTSTIFGNGLLPPRLHTMEAGPHGLSRMGYEIAVPAVSTLGMLTVCPARISSIAD